MCKRLIGKAFAIAMSVAMVLTATPVTENIFHVAHIVKAANEQSDEYVYCYAGLTWNEYWASEGVYAAGNDSSSDTLDSHSELDNGGYDAVTRATTNHGLLEEVSSALLRSIQPMEVLIRFLIGNR